MVFTPLNPALPCLTLFKAESTWFLPHSGNSHSYFRRGQNRTKTYVLLLLNSSRVHLYRIGEKMLVERLLWRLRKRFLTLHRFQEIGVYRVCSNLPKSAQICSNLLDVHKIMYSHRYLSKIIYPRRKSCTLVVISLRFAANRVLS